MNDNSEMVLRFTSKGKQISAEAIGGKNKIEFTKAVSSNDIHLNDTEEEANKITDLDNKNQTVPIKDVIKVKNNVVLISIAFKKSEIKSDYLLNTVGIYVDYQGQELLYAYASLKHPQYMQHTDDIGIYKLYAYITVGDTENVSIKVNDNETVSFDKLKEILKGYVSTDSLKETLNNFGSVKSVGGKKPDKNGNVSLITSTFNHEHVNLDKIMIPGIYKLNGSSCYINDKYIDNYWGYLIVIKSPYIYTEVIQFLVITTYGMVNNYYRVVDDYGTNKYFKRLIDDHDYLNLDNKIDEIDHKELIHHCDNIDSAVAYSKEHPNVLVTTP